jgi:hypothetical protein
MTWKEASVMEMDDEEFATGLHPSVSPWTSFVSFTKVTTAATSATNGGVPSKATTEILRLFSSRAQIFRDNFGLHTPTTLNTM